MTLQVSFEQFPSAVERLLPKSPCFLSSRNGFAVVTAADPAKSVLIASSAKISLDEAKDQLQKAGLEVLEGTWSDDFELALDGVDEQAYVAAVAYASSEDKPGLWLDAYPALPTQVVVLKAMYDEFRETGELDEVTFEEFIRHANPNVVILAPADIHGYLQEKQDPC